MRRYRTFFPCYWTSADIHDLPHDTKLLGAYLLTSLHANMLGCFRLPVAYAVEDLRMGSETVSKGFRSLCDKGFITHDSALSWVLINKFLKWNPIENPNQGVAAAKLVNEVPRNSSVYGPLLDMLRLNPRNFPEGFINGLETVREPFRNQEQEQEQQQQQDSCAALVPSTALQVSPVVLVPLNDGSEFGVTQLDVDEWSRLFPAVDVMQQLRSYRAWALAKPKKRKTRRGIKASLTSWLVDKQDKGGNFQKESHSNGSSYISPAASRQRDSDSNIEKAFQTLAGTEDADAASTRQFFGSGDHHRDRDFLDGRMGSPR